jgi:hypothetical protein
MLPICLDAHERKSIRSVVRGCLHGRITSAAEKRAAVPEFEAWAAETEPSLSVIIVECGGQQRGP